MAQELIIPGRLPGYNELTTGHWARRNRVKRVSMDIVTWEIMRQDIQPVSGKAIVQITCYEPSRKRDPSNVRSGAEKIILDALQNSGIIRNDNWRWLEDKPSMVEYDKHQPRVDVRIEEADTCHSQESDAES